MIHKIKRKDIFGNYPTIEALISDFQRQFFDPEYNEKSDPAYDLLDYPISEGELYHGNCITTLLYGDIHKYPAALTRSLHALLKKLDCKQLIILSFVKLDLFGQAVHQHKDMLRIRQLVYELGDTTNYKEALLTDVEDMGRLVDVFFWLSRLDPELSEFIFWVDQQQRFCFFICDRGNLHWLWLSPDSPLSEALMKQHGFITGVDIDQFS